MAADALTGSAAGQTQETDVDGMLPNLFEWLTNISGVGK